MPVLTALEVIHKGQALYLKSFAKCQHISQMIKCVFNNSKSTVCFLYLYTFALRAKRLLQAIYSPVLWKLDLFKLHELL